MGIVKTTYVASRARGGLGPWSFRRLALALATPRSLFGSVVSSVFSGSGDLDDELFDRVARGIDHRRLTLPPFGVLAGPGACRHPAWRVKDRVPEPESPVRLAWSGLDPAALDGAVRDALAREDDVCVWYASLPWGRGAVLDHDPGGECRVTLRRSLDPVELVVGSAYDDDPASTERGPTTTSWLEITGKSAPDAEDLARSALGARLRAAFGKVWIATDYA